MMDSVKHTFGAVQPTRVLILGGCYAGLSTAINLLDLCSGRSPRFNALVEGSGRSTPVQITIVDERDGYYHIIGSPLAFADKEYARKIWRRYDDIPGLQHESIKVVQGRVQHVDVDAKRVLVNSLDEVVVHEYDYLVAATGLQRVWPVVPSGVLRETYLAEADGHIDAIHSSDGVVVIGGGAVGIEMAAELKMTCPQKKVTLVHSRDHLLSSEPLPDDFKEAVLPLVREQGVEVIMGRRVVTQEQDIDSSGKNLTLSDGSVLKAAVVINAISRSVPTSMYLPAQVLDEEGYVQVNSSLQFHNDFHFAAGDIVRWSGIKRCGGAMHMGFHCAYNIYQHMTTDLQQKPAYKELGPFPPVIGVAIGKTAATWSEMEGTKSGAQTLQYMFGDDLGFTMCWNYMKLSEVPDAAIVDPVRALENEATEQGLEDQSTPVLSATTTNAGSSSDGAETPSQFEEDAARQLEDVEVDRSKTFKLQVQEIQEDVATLAL